SPGSALERRLFPDVSLEHQFARTNTANPFQSQLRMLEVIENTIEEDNIERAQPLGFEVINVHQICRSIGLPGFLDDVESANGIGKGIDSDHFARASLFRLE